MFHIVLYQPEIPPNTGTVMRLAANTGCQLHLIEPLGFFLDDKRLKRAGLDYQMIHNLKRHADFDTYLNAHTQPTIYLCSTKAKKCYTDVHFKPGDSLVFGPETRGLPEELLQQYPAEQKIKIPMSPEGRSLNLATAVSIVTYEAWRQNDFAGAMI